MRRKPIFVELLDSPWWISLTLAACFYLFLKFIFPQLYSQNSLSSPLAESATIIGMPIVYLFIFASTLSALKQFSGLKKSKAIHKRQTGIDTVRDLTWDEFEKLMAHTFRENGYGVIENNKKGPDGGIDLVLKRNGETTLVQCKHWRTRKIGVSIVRELFGVVKAEKADRGIVVGTGKFTEPAMEFAKLNNLDIIDDSQLIDMLEKQLPKFSKKKTQSSNIDRTIDCPRCDGKFVKRVAKKGNNPGREFLGCSNFPKCRESRAL